MAPAAIVHLRIGARSEAVLGRSDVKSIRASQPGSEWGLLLRRMAGGDEAALGTLYDEAGAMVFGLVRRIVWNVDDAEEVTEEIFAQAWTRAASFDAGLGSAAAWLLTMARHRAIDRLRRQRRAPLTTSLDDVGEFMAESDVEEQTIRHRRDERLRQATAKLSPEQRQAVELAFFSGLSHVEIARRLSLPVGTIKTRIRLGMNKLRVALTDEVEGATAEGVGE